jgi:hypothetical protein
MSNEVAVVRFKNGDIFYTAYQGTSSTINYVLLSSEQEVVKNPFPDPVWDAWQQKTEPKESLLEFCQRLGEVVYPDEEAVGVYTHYAGGMYWTAKASRIAMRITGGFSGEDSEDGCPDWAVGLIESNGLKL